MTVEGEVDVRKHPLARLMRRVVKTETCWLWQGPVDKDGYGRFYLEGHRYTVSKAAYILQVGEVPKGLTVDHKCDIRRCVNPEHLQLLTIEDNGRKNVWSRRTHCPQGHAYDETNTHRRPDGTRICRQCRNASSRACQQSSRG